MDTAFHTLNTLHKAGFPAFIVGGAVRDILMGITPHDFDIATSAMPEQVKALFHTYPLGEKFGTVVVVLGGHQFEVTTYRTDAECDGRHAKVQFGGSIKTDLARRDFTINAMAMDADHRITDPFNGREDLKNGVLRAVGDPNLRFEEDYLRMLRAVRFASRLGFVVEAKTLNAIKDNAHNAVRLSADRIRTEIVKMLTHPSRAIAIQMLHDTGLLPHILPEVEALIGVRQPEQYHPEGDVFTHVLRALEYAYDEETALAVLFHDIGKPATFTETDRIRFNGHDKLGAEMTARAMKRLNFSNNDTERVVEAVADHMKVANLSNMRKGRALRFVNRPHADLLVKLHYADRMGASGDLSHYLLMKQLMAEPKPAAKLLTGNDLIDMGMAPSPKFKNILNSVDEAFMDGKIASKEEAVAFVQQYVQTYKEATSCQ